VAENSALEQKKSELVRLRKVAELQSLREQYAAKPEIAPKPEKPFLQDVAEGVGAFLTKGSIGENVPIIGPLAEQTGAYFEAALSPKSIEEVKAQRQVERQKMATEAPGALAAQQLVGGIGGALMIPMPGAGIKDAAGIGSRILGQAGLSAADTALRDKSAAEVGAAGMESGLIQAGFESLPVVGKVAKMAAKPLEKPLAWVGKKAARVLSTLSEEDVAEYAKRMAQINKAPSTENLMDTIDAAVAKKALAVDGAKKALERAVSQADDAFKAVKFDLARVAPSTELADDLIVAIEGQKKVLGDMAEEAEDFIAKKKIKVDKEYLLSFMDKIGRGLGKGIGDEVVAAQSKLMAQRERIAGAYDDVLTGQDLRDIMRQIRKDIKWNQAAGEFNDTLNAARKEFTEGISEVIKKAAPKYAKQMEKMRDISQNLSEMSKNFGTRERAVAALSKAASSKGEFRLEALQKFSDLTGQDFPARLKGVAQARELLDLSKRQDIRNLVIKNQMDAVRFAEKNLEKYADAFEPVARLTPARTQSIISRQGFKNASIKDRRALEALSKELGQDLNQAIKDRNILEQFGKEYTRGSRLTVLGSTIGGGMGGLAGVPIGGAAGAALDKYAGQIIKAVMDKGSLLPGAADKYGRILAEASKQGNKAVILTHQSLLANDRDYQRLMEAQRQRSKLLP